MDELETEYETSLLDNFYRELRETNVDLVDYSNNLKIRAAVLKLMRKIQEDLY